MVPLATIELRMCFMFLSRLNKKTSQDDDRAPAVAADAQFPQQQDPPRCVGTKWERRDEKIKPLGHWVNDLECVWYIYIYIYASIKSFQKIMPFCPHQFTGPTGQTRDADGAGKEPSRIAGMGFWVLQTPFNQRTTFFEPKETFCKYTLED